MGAGSHTAYALRKNGQEEITPIHPELAGPLEDVLGETYGLIVYQEQVLLIAQKLAGFSLGKADLLRKAMGKKKRDVLDAEFVGFSEGMTANGYSMPAIKTLWDILVPFSDYAFNKAHSAAYGLVSYWTAYLKANYPAEYMAALLTSVKDDKDKSALYLNECRRMGMKVLPPDVNESAADYTPRGTDIRFGLAAIRNVGENVVASIAATRAAKGNFLDFKDFLRKVPAAVCNKKTIESLIKAGAFDSLGDSRRGLIERHADAIDLIIDIKRNEAMGQDSLFGGSDPEAAGDDSTFDFPISPLEWDKAVLLAYEREMLGLYVSDHPLFGIEHLISAAADCSIAMLTGSEDREDGSIVTVGGLVSGLQRKVTKKGDVWAIATVEDLEGAIDVMFFPQTYQLYSTNLSEDAVVTIRGRLDRRDDVPKLVAMEMNLLDVSEGPRGPLVISLPVARCTPPVVERIKDVLVTHPGATEVHMRLQSAARSTVWRLGDGFRVNPSPSLMGDLKVLLGPSCLG
jgi:DNA polymerase-3 subunit alpha